MNYNKEFIDLVEIAKTKTDIFYNQHNIKEPNPYYLGYGNPNSNILIIGKEKGFNPENIKQLKAESIDNVAQWKWLVQNDIYNCNVVLDKQFCYNGYEQFKNPIIPYCQINGGGHTWTKYNKLITNILGKNNVNNHSEFLGTTRQLKNTSFLLNSFITEFNTNPSKYSPGSPEISDRINFLSHNFYQKFNVVILACGSYITPYEIKSLFKVDALNLDIQKIPKQKMEFYNSQSKIVVNTNQLSMAISDSYLINIGKTIKEQLPTLLQF